MRISTTDFDNPQGELPLRLTVGIMIFNRAGQVWLGRRRPNWFGDHAAKIWQMPKGGIEHFEAPIIAAEREVREETGITSLSFLAEHPEWLDYELPEALLGVALKGRYRGQRQKWFAAHFTGSDDEIDLQACGPENAEFEDWRWVPIELVAKLGAPHNRHIHEHVVETFRHLAVPRAE